MTGEITLRGTVLPIGGLKEKALAGHRGGVRKILFPRDNENDIDDIPATVRKDLELVPVSHVDQVIFECLICSGVKNFEDLLDGKQLRDDKFFGEPVKTPDEDEEKNQPAAQVTH